MLGKIDQAQSDVRAAIGELTLAGGNTGPLIQQVQFLAAVQRLATSASPSALAEIKTVVAAAVDRADALVAQTRDAGSRTAAQAGQNAAAHQAIADVARDYYDRKLLDPYLQFSSEQDEEEYRKREAKNRAEIERELAKGTPEGDQRARDIMRGQLMDAKDHGADASPDFANLLAKNDIAVGEVSSIRPGTVEAKPLAVAKAPDAAPTMPPPPEGELADIAATLKSAGVVGPPASLEKAGHGVTAIAIGSDAQRSNGLG